MREFYSLKTSFSLEEQTYKRSLTTDESEEEDVDQRTPPRKRRKTSRT